MRTGATFDPYGTNFTSCPVTAAKVINNGNFCGKLLCLKQGVTDGCYGFTLDSSAVRVEGKKFDLFLKLYLSLLLSYLCLSLHRWYRLR
jgi:hypothetical protein